MITRVYMKILGTVETTEHVNLCFKEPFILLFSSYDIVLQLVEYDNLTATSLARYCYDIFLGTLHANLELIGIALPLPPPDNGVRN